MNAITRLYEDMLAFGITSKDRKYSPPDLTKILRLFIGGSDIIVKTRRDQHVDMNQVVIGGFYDPEEDQANFASIMIYVTYNPKQKKIYIRDIDWPRLCIDLIECTGHEIIHQTQYRNRDYDIGPSIFVGSAPEERKRLDQEYLGNTDEIEAYGYSIATELYLKYRRDDITRAQIAKTSMYKAYKAAFGLEHMVVIQLVEFTFKYYKQLSGGTYARIRIKQ